MLVYYGKMAVYDQDRIDSGPKPRENAIYDSAGKSGIVKQVVVSPNYVVDT